MPFNAAGTNTDANIFFGLVIDRVVVVGSLRQLLVGATFVGADRAAPDHVSQDQRFNGGLQAIGNGAGTNDAIALDHAKHHSFVYAPLGIVLPRLPTADERFVNCTLPRR